jgi:pilus assembly protein CpaF
MGNLLISDTQEVDMNNARGTFALAVDMIIQVGWLEDRRQILGVWEIQKELKDGQVVTRQLYSPGKSKIEELSVR